MTNTIAWFLLLALAVPSYGDDTESPARLQGEQALKDFNLAIKNSLTKAAANMDAALAPEEKEQGPNTTKLILRNQITYPEGGPFGITPHFDLHLSLKRLERKL